jgi:endoglucanase
MHKSFISLALSAIIASTYPPTALAQDNRFNVNRCINLGNDLDAPSTGEWNHVIEQSSVQQVAAVGFDTVRVPVRWQNRIGRGPDYVISEAFFERVSEVITWALEANLNVILDVHHFEGLNEAPEKNHAKFLRIWEQISTRYRDLPPSVYFEVINEPNNKFKGDLMRTYMKDAVDIIRQTNPTRQLILGGESYNSINTLDSIPVIDDPNLVHTFHYYDPFTFTHQKTSWTELKDSSTVNWGTDADRAQVFAEIRATQKHQKRTGRSILVGEFGATQDAPHRDMINYLKASREAFEEQGYGWCVWNFTSSFSMYDTTQKSWLPDRLWALGLSDKAPSQLYSVAGNSESATAESSGTKPPVNSSLDAEFNIVRRMLPKDGELIHPPFPDQLTTYGKVRKNIVSDESMPGEQALKARVRRAGKNPWDSGISGPIAGPIKAGDAIVLVFYARTEEGTGEITAAGLQLNQEPFTSEFSKPVSVDENVKRVFISGIASQDFKPGEAGYSFQLASQKQTLFIGPLFVFNLGQGLSADVLP